MTSASPAYAILDGSLCQVSPRGRRTVCHAPLATAVAEFLHGPLRLYVREHPHGLLPGLPNLYCLDAALRLHWLAEWPDASDPCAALVLANSETLCVLAASGARITLDAQTGRLLRVDPALAAAS